MDRKSAQERVDRIKAFTAELRDLDRDGIVTLNQDQRRAVDEYHAKVAHDYEREFDIDLNEDAGKLSLGMKIASVLGALAFSLAVYFFVEQFWGHLPLPAQISLLTTAPLAAIALAELASRRERTLYVTSILCAVAIAGFVVNVTALANLLSLRSSPVSLALLAAFSLLLAQRYRLKLPLFFGLAFAVGFTAMFPRWIAGYAWDDLSEWLELMILGSLAVGWFSTRQPPYFAPVYRAVCSLGLIFSFLGLSTSAGQSVLPVTSTAIEGIYTIIGLAAMALGMAMGIRNSWPEVTILSAVGFVVMLFTKMVDWMWDAIPQYLFFLLIGGISLALIAVFRRIRTRFREQLT